MEVLEGFPNCSTKKFEQRTVEFSSFYGVGSDRILGNDKGWVYLFLQTVNKNYQKAKHARVTLSERTTLYIRLARLTLDFRPVAAYGLSRNSKDQTGNNSH